MNNGLNGFPSGVDTGLPQGGVITQVDNYILHKFLKSGVFIVPTDMYVEVFILAAGGGGGGTSADQVAGGAGAGAGALLIGRIKILAGTYQVTVGLGGLGASIGNVGQNGGDSSFYGYVAKGGGKGRCADNATDCDGGCSGGASGSQGTAAGASTQTVTGLETYTGIGGTKNDGNAGSFAGGAGGSTGGNSTGRTPAAGKSSSFSGQSVVYGRGGYGQGTSNFIQDDVDGADNTGDGGNGARNGAGHVGGDGGSGLVMIKYIL